MKTDWKLWVAILILIGLVSTLIVISVNKDLRVEKALKEIQQLKQTGSIPRVINGVNGHTPVLGVDYSVQNGPIGLQGVSGVAGANGLNGVNGKDGSNGLSAYDLAIEAGFQGTKDQWLASLSVKGDTGDVLQTNCINGQLAQKLSTSSFWQPILAGSQHIKCELSDG